MPENIAQGSDLILGVENMKQKNRRRKEYRREDQAKRVGLKKFINYWSRKNEKSKV